MRLADFIVANNEPILVAWERFARNMWPSALTEPDADPATSRHHAEVTLQAIAEDMRPCQIAEQGTAKFQGVGEASTSGISRTSTRHGVDRRGSGLEMWAVLVEYRAMRASVMRLWRESGPQPDLSDLDDITRFNESIDQSLTEAVRSYSDQVERDRKALLEDDRAARKEAEEANRAKDMFLATLSHEMRTPLNAIVGWLTLLRMPGFAEENLAEGLDVIERNTKAQVQLIENVLDVSRIISGKLRLEISDCDLAKAITAGIDVVRPTADAREITLDVQLDPVVTHASCDATRIQQIVWNLLTNAIKFSDKGGTVRVTLNREQSCYQIGVSDNGQGISPELLPYVFDRFRQADSSTRRRFGGLGLGLSIVKHLVEMHGGTVEAQSPGDGQGATFIIRLPIKAVRVDEVDMEVASTVPSVTASLISSMPPQRLDGVRVLVVDDEADARGMLSKVLEAVGARVATAASAAEALTVLTTTTANNEGPDVLVSDVGMPEQNGYDLIREVRKRGHQVADLPAMALTAFARKDDVRDALEAGFQTHLPKPVDVRDLTAAICSLVHLKDLRGDHPVYSAD